jgi:hypothetical protein
MTKTDRTRKRTILVAVDIAKSHNEILIESAMLVRRCHFKSRSC